MTRLVKIARPDILCWVPLPPPFSGPSVVSSTLMKALTPLMPMCVVENANFRTSNVAKGRVDLEGLVGFCRSYARFVRAMARRRCGVVYMVIAPNLIGFLRDAVLIWSAVIFRKRLILHLLGGNYGNFYSSSPTLVRFLVRNSWGLAHRAIVEASSLRGMLHSAAPNVPVSVLSNGIDISRQAEHANRRHDDEEVTLLFLGYLSFMKGFYDLMHTYKRLHAAHGRRVRLVMAGELPTGGRQHAAFLSGGVKDFFLENLEAIEEEIRIFVSTAGEYNAVYLGVVSEAQKEELLSTADILVLPSYMEGLSMAILEAMCAGLPVVATTVGANATIIRDGENGFLVAPGDRVDLEAKLTCLMLNTQLREQMGRSNMQQVKDNHSIESVAKEMVAILALV